MVEGASTSSLEEEANATGLSRRFKRQLAAKDATITFLRKELFRLAKQQRQWQPSTSSQKERLQRRLYEEVERAIHEREVRRLKEQLGRERQHHRERLAREREYHRQDLTRANSYYRVDMQREREYRERDFDHQRAEIDRLWSFAVRHVQDPRPSDRLVVPSSAQVEPRAQPPPVTRSLTCARVVGLRRLHRGLDLLPLISSFLLSTGIPIDLAVSRCSHHITSWLLSNGVQPTTQTIAVAVATGDLAIVQIVFAHMKGEVDVANLPVGSSTRIVEWLQTTYPSKMAREFVRLVASDANFLHDKWQRYVERLKHQREWEEALETERWRRKRQRLEL